MSSRTKVYTGIGSRATPEAELSRIIAIAAHLRVARWKLRSGGADGADTAFETGAAPYMEIYLPWKKYNGRLDPSLHSDSTKLSKNSMAMLIAADVHPAWHLCDQAARKLHTRNVFQVLGPNLDEPSKFVICWTIDGKYKGGTRTALVLAERNNIPVFNLADYALSRMDPETIAQKAIQADLFLHPATA